MTRGAAFTATDVTRNRGKRLAKRSRTGYFLSLDRKRGKGDVRLAARRAVKGLRAGRKSRGKRRLRVPLSATGGRYHLLACADVTKKTRERKEGNNCRASRRKGVLPTVATPPAPTCSPSAPDVPDPVFFDANCDGIDGNASGAVFVATYGANNASCGAQAAPCAAVQVGIDRAVALGRRHVYVAGGTYIAAIRLADGVSVYGGFGQNFQRAPAKATGSRETIVQGQDGVEVVTGEINQAVAIVAVGLTQSTTIADMTVRAPNPGFLLGGPGRSSYGVIAKDVPAGVLAIARNRIVGGSGAAGDAGGIGPDAALLTATPEMTGGTGDPAGPGTDPCDETVASPGPAGTNTGLPEATGGAGGTGGMRDAACPDSTTATTGSSGDSGQAGAAGGSGGELCAPLTDGNGENGLVADGTAGSAAIGGGQLIGPFWYGRDGGGGQTGAPGGGGGGGGGSGGCDTGTIGQSFGAAGGGGGAGGAPGAGGGGGNGGGGSFGIYLIAAAPAIVDNGFTRGAAGAGGGGGNGGQGQDGGPGGPGGAAHDGSAAGGAGGAGGRGGHGGGGSGGAGGSSFAIYLTAGSSGAGILGNIAFGGSAGAGGAGGVSSPGAVGGNDGPSGAMGTVGSIGP